MELTGKRISTCGDWKLIFNQDKDNCDNKHINDLEARKHFETIDSSDVKDARQELYPSTKSFTWQQPTPQKQALLDKYLFYCLTECSTCSGRQI